MKAFDLLSVIAELGVSNDVYTPFTENAQIDMVAVWSDSEERTPR